jgi:hypothetical protein
MRCETCGRDYCLYGSRCWQCVKLDGKPDGDGELRISGSCMASLAGVAEANDTSMAGALSILMQRAEA